MEVAEEQAGQRLDNFLHSRLKGVPKSRIYRIIRKGEVRVNKKREKPEYKLEAGDQIRIPPVRMAEPRELIPPSDALQELLSDAVLLDDPDFMVINKPAGLPVHGGTGVKTGLIEALRHMYPAMTGLELVHRLDKGTSGCILVAKNARALKFLSDQFKTGKVNKTYHALVQGTWPDSLEEIDAPLERCEPRGGERLVKVSPSGKSALTGFTILEVFSAATLVQANPRTGRTHQIRVHARHADHPMIGDDKYSEEADRERFGKLGIKRLCLHAARLELVSPGTGKRLRVDAPYDSQFEAAISLLRQPAGD